MAFADVRRSGEIGSDEDPKKKVHTRLLVLLSAIASSGSLRCGSLSSHGIVAIGQPCVSQDVGRLQRPKRGSRTLEPRGNSQDAAS